MKFRTPHRLVLLALILVVAACNRSAASRLQSVPEAPDTALGPGDIFEIRVFGEQALTGKYQVSSDGTIRYPFLGSVLIAGKDVNQVASEIAASLKERELLLDPQVYVYLEQSNSKRISVLGAVSNPGTFPIVAGMTLVHAISNAGGFTPLASKDDTVITRKVNGELHRYRVAVTAVTRGDANDFTLRAGDIVFIPERVF